MCLRGTLEETKPITPITFLKMCNYWLPKSSDPDTYKDEFFHSGEITIPSITSFQPNVHLACGDISADDAHTPTSIGKWCGYVYMYGELIPHCVQWEQVWITCQFVALIFMNGSPLNKYVMYYYKQLIPHILNLLDTALGLEQPHLLQE